MSGPFAHQFTIHACYIKSIEKLNGIFKRKRWADEVLKSKFLSAPSELYVSDVMANGSEQVNYQ